MIKGVGPGPSSSRIETVRTRVAEQGASSAVAGVSATGGAREATHTAITQMRAEGAPVDGARVAELRAKIASGDYAVDPRAIADRMLALDLPGKGDA